MTEPKFFCQCGKELEVQEEEPKAEWACARYNVKPCPDCLEAEYKRGLSGL